MYFKSIELKSFRNYKEEKVEFDPKLNLILGDNAQGKTNLLEGLFIMGIGKSFKTNNDKEMIKYGFESCRVSSVVVNKDGEEKNIEIVYNNSGKVIKVDGIKLLRNADLLENVYVVVFSPEDLRIVKDGPEMRRRFLDRELCQIKPVYYSDLGSYKKILKQRNTLLRDQVKDKNLVEVFDESLSEYAVRVVEERKKFISRIKEICKGIHSGISNGKEELDIVYQTETKSKAYMKDMLAKELEKDYQRGFTGFGPHKDYLSIKVNNRDIRIYGSQGQQRTAALSLKLAEIELIKQETGENAVLLLDDVLSELDRARQRYLIETMKDVQIFVSATGIDEELKNMLPDGNVYYVDNGKISLYNR